MLIISKFKIKNMQIKSIIASVADVKNSHGRIYTLEAMTKAVEDFKKLTKERLAFGFISRDTPVNLSIPLSEVSHIVDDINMDGDMLKIDVTFLNNKNGTEAKKLYESGEFAFRTFSTGIMSNSTITDFKLISFNLVSKDDDPFVEIIK